MNTEQSLCDLTAKLWHYYLMEPSQAHFQELVQALTEPFSMIGTGKQELVHSLDEMIENLSANLGEAQQIHFDLLDEWYQCVMLRPDIAIVYGGIWVREHTDAAQRSLVEMDTRFTIVYARNADGAWKMAHVHHSMPYFDQGPNENYPKALSTQVREALKLVELFKKRAEMDLMTVVYNHESFQKQVETLLHTKHALDLYILDCDNFKTINDTYGHGSGDTVLKQLATVLQRYFSKPAFVGRIGGDEFAICDLSPGSNERIDDRLGQMQAAFTHELSGLIPGISASYSIGIARSQGEPAAYRQLFQQADRALYLAKRAGKNRHTWAASGS